MTKGELRKLRKQTGRDWKTVGTVPTYTSNIDRDDTSACDFGPERLPGGRYNMRRARALERHARMVYETDRF